MADGASMKAGKPWRRTRRHAPRAEPLLSPRAFDLLCLTMAAVLALHARHMPWWLSVPLALALGLRWWQRRRNGGRIAWWLRVPLTLLLPVLVVGTYGTLFGQRPGTALAVGLLVLKTLESERPRDARTGIAFACFALMCALLFGQGLVMTGAVMLGLLPALACLKALEPGPASAAWSDQFKLVLKALVLAAPLALAAFLFLPRLSSPLWGAPLADRQARTGIGGSMSPGDFTQLLVDDSPAFRVQFDAAVPPPSERYFRGPVLWWFDGRSWSTGGPWSRRMRHAPPEVMGHDGTVYRYQVTMEPSHRRWVFALDTPLAAPQGTRMGPERSLSRRKPVDRLLQYRAASAPHHVLAPRLDDFQRHMALELPVGFDPRARDLAASWRSRHDDDMAIVREALALFHDGGFRYTLAPAPLGRDSVDDFLFATREGFCEHYASAFTFLMRAAGIPARVVTGYQGGFMNTSAGYLLVRQSDAHAWSEVWIRGHGWVRVDPTAAVRPERISLGAAPAAGDSAAWYQHGWWRTLRNHWDIVNHWWDQRVIGFNALRQGGMLTAFGVRHVNTTTLLVALAASLVLAMGLAGLLTLLPRRRDDDPLAAAMALLRQRLARAGVASRASEGPADFFARAARMLPHEHKQLNILGKSWMDLRYAQITPDPAAIRAFRRAVRDFRPRRAVE